MNEHNCKVCGLYIEELPWGIDGKSPSYEICDCCGVEFGNEDYSTESILLYREKWLKDGANWFRPKEKPKYWNLKEQLGKVSC
jgi:hypothetical protein